MDNAFELVRDANLVRMRNTAGAIISSARVVKVLFMKPFFFLFVWRNVKNQRADQHEGFHNHVLNSLVERPPPRRESTRHGRDSIFDISPPILHHTPNDHGKGLCKPHHALRHHRGITNMEKGDHLEEGGRVTSG
ncbi:unnamed protein product [Phytomonas sp. Hart1]|nr:unnamed protein product [Phytomonas sp. Hart1]|eukprot:CCW66009.1 unnamed protein product [Phytomonas sp. isolate Hart1]